MADDPGWITLPDGRRVPVGQKRSSRAVAGAAVAIVVAAAAGGSAGSEAAVSGAADGFSAGARISQSQEADEFSIRARTSRGRAEVRVRGSDDSVKATFRLRSLSRHPTTLNAESTTDCVSYSDGAAQRFLEEHRCVSLHRTLIEIRERNYTVRFATATIEMPDYLSTQDLSELLAKKGSGDITPLLPKGGKYPHFPFVSASSHTTWHDTVVINTRVQGLGRTPSTALVASLATSVLFSLD